MAEIVIFNGVKFRRYPHSRHANHRKYFTPGIADAKRGVEALHREIWKSENGPIPDGHDIHHRDEDFSNNDPKNLECIPKKDHTKLHGNLDAWFDSVDVKAHLDEIRPLTKEWHASDEGLSWHSEHAKRAYEQRDEKAFICLECGKGFKSKNRYNPREDGGRFCSDACTKKTLRKEGRHLFSKVCEACNTEFMGTKRARTCSKTCGANLRWKTVGRSKPGSS